MFKQNPKPLTQNKIVDLFINDERLPYITFSEEYSAKPSLATARLMELLAASAKELVERSCLNAVSNIMHMIDMVDHREQSELSIHGARSVSGDVVEVLLDIAEMDGTKRSGYDLSFCVFNTVARAITHSPQYDDRFAARIYDHYFEGKQPTEEGKKAAKKLCDLITRRSPASMAAMHEYKAAVLREVCCNG